MDCGDCAKTVEQSLRTLPGVSDAAVNFIRGTADVTYDPARVSTDAMERRISALGYRAAIAAPSPAITRHRHDSDEDGHENGHSPDAAGAPWVFDVTGMDCGDCAKTVQSGVMRLPGVREAAVNFAVGTLTVSADAAATSIARRCCG